jgi:hypothetical protein
MSSCREKFKDLKVSIEILSMIAESILELRSLIKILCNLILKKEIRKTKIYWIKRAFNLWIIMISFRKKVWEERWNLICRFIKKWMNHKQRLLEFKMMMEKIMNSNLKKLTREKWLMNNHSYLKGEIFLLNM